MFERLGLDALKYRPFRLYFGVNFLSNSSWFVFNAGFGWYVLNQTGSAATVGLAFFLAGLPFVLFTAHAGVLADQLGPRRVVAISLALSGSLIFALGLLAFVPGVPLWLVLGLSFVVGVAQTIGGPGGVAILNNLVAADAVSSAVALTFLGISVGRILGGMVGGVIVAIWPAPLALLVAGCLQAAPAIPIWRLRLLTPEVCMPSSRAIIRPILEASGYGVRFPTLGVILLLAALPGSIGLSYNYLLPVAARDLGIGGEGLGLLLAMAGAGGLVAGLLAESLMRRFGHGKAILVGLATSAGGMVAFGIAPLVGISVVSMLFVGAGFIVYSAASLSLIQALAPAHVRGRITSLFSLLYWGLMPTGGLLGGFVAQAFGARAAFASAGVVLLAAAVLTALGRRQILSLRVARDGTTTADGVVVNLAA